MAYTLLDDNNGRALVQVRDDADHDFWIPREKYLASLEKQQKKRSTSNERNETPSLHK